MLRKVNLTGVITQWLRQLMALFRDIFRLAEAVTSLCKIYSSHKFVYVKL